MYVVAYPSIYGIKVGSVVAIFVFETVKYKI